jgi:hypothetical protein
VDTVDPRLFKEQALIPELNQHLSQVK